MVGCRLGEPSRERTPLSGANSTRDAAGPPPSISTPLSGGLPDQTVATIADLPSSIDAGLS